jgi:hypothetical protein
MFSISKQSNERRLEYVPHMEMKKRKRSTYIRSTNPRETQRKLASITLGSDERCQHDKTKVMNGDERYHKNPTRYQSD